MKTKRSSDEAETWSISAYKTGVSMFGSSHIERVTAQESEGGSGVIAGAWVSPWLSDTHTHGMHGRCVSSDWQEMGELVDSYQASGVGHVQLSTVTLDNESTQSILEAAQRVKTTHASFSGIHLEGPFLSFEKRGAHCSKDLQFGDLELVKKLLADYVDVVTAITVDPRSVGAGVINWLVEQGVTVAIGHTEATYDETVSAFTEGASVLTHAFNAMRPIAARDPGPILAAINHSAWIELIADGWHVHPALVNIVFDLVPNRVVLVSDSIPATGLADGPHSLGPIDIQVVKGVARTRDGSLAGSTLSLEQAVRNVVGWGVPADRSIAAATIHPRAAYGMPVPNLTPGDPANILVWSESMVVTHILKDGIPRVI